MKTPAQIQKIEQGFTKAGSQVSEQAKVFRNSTFQRFPIVFSLLTTFGLVATFYGFEKVIDRIAFFTNNPEVLLLVGIMTLAATGTLYKKLR